MAKKKKRDSEYLIRRVEKEFPAIYADYKDGKYTSVRQAAAAAGLIRLPTNVDDLKRAFKKATPAELSEFAKWARLRMPTKAPAQIADADGYLRADVRKFLADWLAASKSRPARIMKEMGLSGYDVTLWGAIKRDEPVKKKIIDRLGPWLSKNGFR